MEVALVLLNHIVIPVSVYIISSKVFVDRKEALVLCGDVHGNNALLIKALARVLFNEVYSGSFYTMEPCLVWEFPSSPVRDPIAVTSSLKSRAL